MTKYKVVVPDAIDLGVRRNRRRRAERSLCHDDNAGAVRHADQRSEAVEDRRTLGLGCGAGAHSRAESGASVGGWTFGVPQRAPEQGVGVEFIQFATSKEWMRRSLERGNAPPRVSVLNQPDVQRGLAGRRCWPRPCRPRHSSRAMRSGRPWVATAQWHFAGAAGAADGQGGAGRGGGRLATQPAAAGIEGVAAFDTGDQQPCRPRSTENS